jgi:hypothetical protein
MIWNYARIKITFLGIVGLIISYGCAINIFAIIDAFTPFEKITLLMLVFISIMISIVTIFHGIEPILPDLKIFEQKR